MNIINFIDQVKQEVTKVSWPSRKETFTSSTIVIVMVVFTSLFFLVVDSLIQKIVHAILNFGS